MMKEKLGKRNERKKFMFIGIFIEFHIPQTNLLTIEINKFSPKCISLHICESFKFFFSVYVELSPICRISNAVVPYDSTGSYDLLDDSITPLCYYGFDGRIYLSRTTCRTTNCIVYGPGRFMGTIWFGTTLEGGHYISYLQNFFGDKNNFRTFPKPLTI